MDDISIRSRMTCPHKGGQSPVLLDGKETGDYIVMTSPAYKSMAVYNLRRNGIDYGMGDTDRNRILDDAIRSIGMGTKPTKERE